MLAQAGAHTQGLDLGRAYSDGDLVGAGEDLVRAIRKRTNTEVAVNGLRVRLLLIAPPFWLKRLFPVAAEYPKGIPRDGDKHLGSRWKIGADVQHRASAAFHRRVDRRREFASNSSSGRHHDIRDGEQHAMH